jgi:hypothetical protein
LHRDLPLTAVRRQKIVELGVAADPDVHDADRVAD